jgi:omptin
MHYGKNEASSFIRKSSLAMKRIAAFAALLTLLTTSTAFGDDRLASSVDDSIWISGSVGLINLDAKEYVYTGAFKLSELDWKSRNVAVYSATIGADIYNDWTIKGGIDIGGGGNGFMTDYDWIEPFYTDNSMNGWSHRSRHPDTGLQTYFSGSVELQRKLLANDSTSLAVNGGFKYTDVKWNARGGSMIYSVDAPRDTIDEFEDGKKVISYEQKIPVFYAGFNGSLIFDRLTLSGGLQGGVTSGINDIDNHWLRSLRFKDSMEVAPVFLMNASVDYRVTDNASIYVAGNFEKVFRARGDTAIVDTSSGATGNNPDTAGAAFRSVSVKVGLKARF